MTCNILIYWRQLWYVFLPNLKRSPDYLRLFSYCAPPKGMDILLIKFLWLLHWLGYIDTKLVRLNEILWLQLSNDAVALLRHIPDPPCKFWVACNMSMYRIFCHLHRVRVLRILEGHPCSSTILPLDKYFNPLCCLSEMLCSGTHCYERVLLHYLLTFVHMVDNLLE